MPGPGGRGRGATQPAWQRGTPAGGQEQGRVELVLAAPSSPAGGALRAPGLPSAAPPGTAATPSTSTRGAAPADSQERGGRRGGGGGGESEGELPSGRNRTRDGEEEADGASSRRATCLAAVVRRCLKEELSCSKCLRVHEEARARTLGGYYRCDATRAGCSTSGKAKSGRPFAYLQAASTEQGAPLATSGSARPPPAAGAGRPSSPAAGSSFPAVRLDRFAALAGRRGRRELGGAHPGKCRHQRFQLLHLALPFLLLQLLFFLFLFLFYLS